MIYDHLVALGYKPIFLVFSTSGEESQNDALFIRRVMIGRTYNITKNITQTLDVFPFLYAVVGMRLHSGILACVHEIPFLPISYGLKTNELIKSLEIEHLAIQAEYLSLDFFMTKWNLLISNYQREHLRMGEKHKLFSKNLIDSLEKI
jgi:hypothetical protein